MTKDRGPVYCEERQRLEDAVSHAVREVLALQDAGGAAVGPGFKQLLLARKLAVQRHDDAKRAWLLHACSRCS